MWLTIPNLLTMVRIVMTPFILIELARGRYMVGGWMFGAAAFTDILDGGLARRFGTQSETGQYLDPVADKILLSCIYVGLALGGAVPGWIVVLIFARDIWILLLSGVALRFHIPLVLTLLGASSDGGVKGIRSNDASEIFKTLQ